MKNPKTDLFILIFFSLFYLRKRKESKEKTRFKVQRISRTAVRDSGRCPETLRAFEKARAKLCIMGQQSPLTATTKSLRVARAKREGVEEDVTIAFLSSQKGQYPLT